MMGLRTKTSAGDVVVDADYRNIRVFDEGSKSTSAGTYTLSHRAEPRTPFCFLCPRTTRIGLVRPASTTYDAIKLDDVDGGEWDYALCSEKGKTWDNENWGIKVWDANSEVVIDAREKFAIIKDVLEINPRNYDWTKTHRLTHTKFDTYVRAYYSASSFNGAYYELREPNTGDYYTYIYRAAFQWVDYDAVEFSFPYAGSFAGKIADQDLDYRPSQWVILVAEITD